MMKPTIQTLPQTLSDLASVNNAKELRYRQKGTAGAHADAEFFNGKASAYQNAADMIENALERALTSQRIW